MKIWIYYHIAQLPGWKELVEEKIKLMKTTGLWNAADKIVIQLHYDPYEGSGWARQNMDLIDARVEVVPHIERFGFIGFRPSFKPVGEVYSIRELHDDCNRATENTAVFHFHTKGITHRWDETWPVAEKWNEYLEYWNIKNWQLCVKSLEAGYDTVGANWHNGCWSGTIWWASTDFIKKIPLLKWPHEVKFEKQLNGWSNMHDAEHWIGQQNPRRLTLHQLDYGINYYQGPEPAEYKFNS